MAVTDEMNDLSSSHHRRLEAENAAKQALRRPPSNKSREGSQTSVETHSSEEEEYLANDPYLAELLNSNHSRTTSSSFNYVPKPSSTATMTSLSAHEATRTWNDLSSVHSKADAALNNQDSASSSSSFMDSTSSMASFGNSEDGDDSNRNLDHSESGNGDDDDDDEDEDLSLQKQAFQKLFDSPRKDAKEVIAAAAASSLKVPPLVTGPGGRRKFRSSSVKVRPTYHGPKLGLIEENSMH